MDIDKVVKLAAEIRTLEEQASKKRQALEALFGPKEPKPTNGNGKRRRGVQMTNYNTKYGASAPDLVLRTLKKSQRPVPFKLLAQQVFSDYGMRKGTVSSTLFNLQRDRVIKVVTRTFPKASGQGNKKVKLYSAK